MPMLLTFAADNSNTVQNVYTPLPMGAHLVFCIAATMIYLAQYARKGSPHYLLIMAAIDLTFITQINTSKTTINILFVAEVVLLIAAAFVHYRWSRTHKNAPDAPRVESEYPDAPDAGEVKGEYPDAPDAEEYPDADDTGEEG